MKYMTEDWTEQLRGYSAKLVQNKTIQLAKIGGGSYGTVYAGSLPGHGIVAIKQMLIGPRVDWASIRRELTITYRVRHSHIVRMLGMSERPDRVYMYLELTPGGTLLSLLNNHLQRVLLPSEALPYFLDTASALHYIHTELGLVHFDVKMDNVLIGADGHCKLADFGLAQQVPLGQAIRAPFATAHCTHLPPEMTSTFNLVFHTVDWYSLGVLLYGLLHRALPYTKDYYMPPIDAHLGPNVHHLLLGLMELDARRRLGSGSQLFAHPWLLEHPLLSRTYTSSGAEGVYSLVCDKAIPVSFQPTTQSDQVDLMTAFDEQHHTQIYPINLPDFNQPATTIPVSDKQRCPAHSLIQADVSLAVGGSLWHICTDFLQRGLTPREAFFYFAEITEALIHLHSHGIVHTNLTPKRVYIGWNGHVMLGHPPAGQSCERSTYPPDKRPNHWPPAVLTTQSIHHAFDWFSLGSLLKWAINNKSPSVSTRPISPALAHLIDQLLHPDPHQRLGGSPRDGLDVLEHAWVRENTFDIRGSCQMQAEFRLFIQNKKLQPPFRPHAQPCLQRR